MVIFVVVGGLGKSLTVSKVQPIVNCPNVSRVYVFHREGGYEIPGACYITLPLVINSIRPRILRRIIRHIVEPIQIMVFALRYHPDCFHGFFTLPKGLYSTVLAKLVGAIGIVSVIGGEREISNPYLPFTGFWRWLNLTLLRSCDIVTTKGQRDNQYLAAKGIPNEKIFVYNGSIDTNVFFWDERKSKDIDILFVGKFSEVKGPDRVLEVVKRLRRTNKRINCVLLGDGPLFTTIRNQIRVEQLEENVELVGYVNDTPSYYQRSRLLILPSLSEGLATSMLEAMACGCVPIVTNVGCQSEAAIHNSNAMVVEDYQDIEVFTQYAMELLKGSGKRRRLARNGSRLVREKYSVSAQSSVYSAILEYGIRNNVP